MAQVTIDINGREYGIACDSGDEGHIIKLARLLDQKAKLLTSGNGHINENHLLAMVGLLLADELEEIKKNSAAITQCEPVVQTVEIEKIVEKKTDFAPIDKQLSEKLNSVADEIKSVANAIKTW